MTSGKLEMVQPRSDAPLAGNVYLLRGFIGIWSYGIDKLGDRVREAGIRANVYQESQWQSLADTIIEKYQDVPDPEPLVLIGHSYGADDAVLIAQRLAEHNIRVDLVVTLDPVSTHKVPKNVVMCYNLYQPNFLDLFPFFRGVPLDSELADSSNVKNVNIRTDRRDLLEPGTDHFNIEKKGTIHAEIVKKVKEYCPPRSKWLASRPGMRYSAAASSSGGSASPEGGSPGRAGAAGTMTP